MTERPTILRQQVWRFRDGREGVVASTNAIGVTFYVGPQAIMVPTGDLDAALFEATLVTQLPIAQATTQPEAEVIVETALDHYASAPSAKLVEEKPPSRRGRYRKGEPKV